MIILENDFLYIEIAQKGAELTRVQYKETGIDYIWSGNPEGWGRHAPVLFPTVGKLVDNTFMHAGKNYDLPQHGFARDSMFHVASATKTAAQFILSDTSESRGKYPFAFELTISYRLSGSTLEITWQVTNTDTQTLYFAIGAHPAFSTQLVEGDTFTDYHVEFAQPEDLTAMVLDPTLGLFNGDVLEVSEDVTHLELKRELFKNDALVFNNFQGGMMSLRSLKHNHGVTYRFADFPYVALWTPADKTAEFICLEPWFGYADTVEGPFEIADKPGMQKLAPKHIFDAKQSLEFF